MFFFIFDLLFLCDAREGGRGVQHGAADSRNITESTKLTDIELIRNLKASQWLGILLCLPCRLMQTYNFSMAATSNHPFQLQKQKSQSCLNQYIKRIHDGTTTPPLGQSNHELHLRSLIALSKNMRSSRVPPSVLTSFYCKRPYPSFGIFRCLDDDDANPSPELDPNCGRLPEPD